MLISTLAGHRIFCSATVSSFPGRSEEIINETFADVRFLAHIQNKRTSLGATCRLVDDWLLRLEEFCVGLEFED